MPRADIVIRALLLAALLTSLPDGAAGQPSGARPSGRLSLLDVPYLSQSEALCGGAAAAMVLRYWGATGVTAEDFAPLVDRSRSGIETAALAAAVRERGFDARPVSGTADVVARELTAGRPAIALIEDRPGAFHYVVVVGWHARAVVLHDPARTPYVVMRPDEFERRWKASSNWMLVIVPDAPPSTAPVDRSASPETPNDPESAADPCQALVRDGVRRAQQNQLAEAERFLADAVYRCSDAASYRELAGVRVLQRRWPEAADLAARALERDAGDLHAWRILATARYISGDTTGALEAWNKAGEPRVDLVTMAGLQRTSHRTVERYLDVGVGEVLSPAVFARARRRLDELPAAAVTRVEYVPRGSGLAELRGHVVERTVVPRGRITWAAIGLRAAAQREVLLPVASLGHGGERLDVSWRFWPNRPAAAIALHAPLPASLVSLEIASERQPFVGEDPPQHAERLAATARIATWATSWLRWETHGGVARWQTEGSFATAGGAMRIAAGRAHAAAGIDTWFGDRSFAGGMLQAGWRSSHERRGFVLDVLGGIHAIAPGAPLDLWPAGDTGHARTTLLRAHPVLDDGRLRVERLGRSLMHASAEAQQWWRAAGAVPIGAVLFVDVGRTGQRRAAAPVVTDVDAGGGFRLALPGRAGLLRLDMAHGLRDGRHALSIAWER